MKPFSCKLTALLIALLSIGGLYADELTVAAGTDTSDALPIHGSQCDIAFKNQLIYPSSLLEEMKDCTIRSLTFYSVDETRQSLGARVTIYIAEVEEESFGSDSYLTPAFTKVYEGMLDISDYQVTFELAAPYAYKGGNLLVEIVLSKTGLDVATNFYGSHVSGSGLCGWQEGYSMRNVKDFLPKTTFRYCSALRSLPLTEGFEEVAVNDIPPCWDRTQAPNAYVEVNSEYSKGAYLGDKYLRIMQVDATTPQTLVLPAIATEMKALNISFYYKTAQTWPETRYGNLVVGYRTTDGTFVGLDTLPQTSEYTAYDLNLVNAGDDAAYIALSYISGTGTYGWANIDEVVVSLIPSCIKPTEVHETEVTASSATITWTAHNDESAWEIRISNNGTDWSEAIPATANPFTLTGLEADTDYWVRVKAVCSGDDSSEWSYARAFHTECSTWTPPLICTFDDQTLNHPAKCWDNSGSTATTSDYAYIPDGIWSVYTFGNDTMIRLFNSQVTKGTALVNTPRIALPATPMELEFDYSHRADCGAFTIRISTDDGLNFTDLKSYDNPTGYPYYNATDPGVFYGDTIDLSAYAGQTVILQFFANANKQQGAIFVDNVEIREHASCLKPKNVTVSDVTDHTVSVAWHEKGDATAWQLQLSPDGSVWGEVIAADSNPFTLTGLEADTRYYVRVKADCGGGDESGWSTQPATFKTDCGAQSLPLSEDFEDALSSCWDLASEWTLDDTEHVSGNRSIRFEAGKATAFTMPAVVLDEEAQLTLWNKSAEVSFWVYANTVSDETNLATISPSGEWKKDTISLSAYTGQTVRLIVCGFYHSYKYLYIDDVAVEYKPVAVPQHLEAKPGDTGASISWEAVDEAVSYNLRWRDKTETEWIVENLNTTGKTLEGLTNNHTYEAQVQAVVSSHRQSAWTEVAEFTPLECPDVIAVTLGEQKYNYVVVNWTATATSTWSLRYSADGGVNWTVASTTIGEQTFTLGSLRVNGEYIIAVKPSCSGDEAWVVADETYTTCLPSTPNGWTEGFENFDTGFFGLLCWDDLNAMKEGLHDYPQVLVYDYDPTYVRSGRKSLFFRSSEYKSVYAILPPFTGSFTGAQITFWHKEEHGTSSGKTTIGYMTNIRDEESFVPLKVCGRKTKEWKEETVSLTSVPTGARLAFRYGDTEMTGYVAGIDDISIISSLPTVVESTFVEPQASKHIENDQLVIIRDGVKYNAQGQKLQ